MTKKDLEKKVLELEAEINKLRGQVLELALRTPFNQFYYTYEYKQPQYTPPYVPYYTPPYTTITGSMCSQTYSGAIGGMQYTPLS